MSCIKNNREYCPKYDHPYDIENRQWLESKCQCGDCDCPSENRPNEHPIDCTCEPFYFAVNMS